MDLRDARRRRQTEQAVADARPPIITALSSTSDRTPGGAALAVTGSNFLPGATVFIGGVAATNVVVVDEHTITFNAPPGTEGPQDVVVVNTNGLTATLAQAFEYIAGHVFSVTPSRGLTTGGQSVLIRGVNFVDGSTIAFGGVLATGVIFIDSQHFAATTPAHADGTVDVEITEPSTAVVTARHGYIFSSRVFQDDIRRQPSITINSSLNGGVNTARFVVDGQGVPPIGGEKVIFTDEDELIFAGTVQGVDQMIELSPENWAWPVHAVDHSAQFNRLRPFGVYHNTSATTVVKEWVARYAPGFTTEFVRTNLPRISITADGEQDFATLMNMICEKIGAGHWRVDYRKRVHCFCAAKPPVFSAALTMPPGAPIVVSASATPVSGYGLIPGYYYFVAQGEYGHPKTYPTGMPNTPPASEPYVLLSDQAAQLIVTGAYSNGRYVEANPAHPSGSQPYWPRGWIGFTAAGNRGTVSNPPKPWVLGHYYYASKDVASEMEARVPGWFKTALTPISNLVYLANTLPSFDSLPTFPDIAGIPCHTRRIFAVRYSDATVFGRGVAVGGAPLHGYAVIADNVTLAAVLPPAAAFPAPVQPAAVLPFAPPGVPMATETAALNSAAALFPRDAQRGYWSFVVTGTYQDGTESRGTLQSPPVLLDGAYQVTLTLPIGIAINGVPVIFRKVYACLFTPFTPLTLGTPDFTQGGSKLVAIVPDNVAGSVTFAAGAMLVGGNREPANVPPGMAHELGPDLEEINAPEDLVDDSPLLLLEPPLTSSSDTSQLRNRVYVKGKGSIVVADSEVGDRFLQVADTSTFVTPSGGGTVILGSRILAYTSLSTVVGAGSLNLAVPLTEPVSQSDWLFGGGLPVRPFLQLDDLESQQARGAIETDDEGNPTDGVHEFTIPDDTLTTYDQMLAAGLADLTAHAWPVVTLSYATRDPTEVGTVVHVDMTKPPLVGDFLIQEVTVDQFHDVSDAVLPRYNVTASPVRLSLDDLLMRGALQSRGGGVPSLSGIVATAAVSSAGAIPYPTTRTPFWTTVGGAAVAALSSVNATMTAAQGGIATQDDVQGRWLRRNFTNLNSGQSVLLEATTATTWVELNPFCVWRFRTRSVAPLRLWVYFQVPGDPPMSNNDTNVAGLCRGFGVFYSSVRGGGWTVFKTRGTDNAAGPMQFFDDLGPCAANTEYVISFRVSAMVVTITVNGKSARLPVADFSFANVIGGRGVFPLIQAIQATTAIVASGFDFKSFYMDKD